MNHNCNTCRHAFKRHDGPQCEYLGENPERRYDQGVARWVQGWCDNGAVVTCPDWPDNCPGWDVSMFALEQENRKMSREIDRLQRRLLEVYNAPMHMR